MGPPAQQILFSSSRGLQGTAPIIFYRGHAVEGGLRRLRVKMFKNKFKFRKKQETGGKIKICRKLKINFINLVINNQQK
jgi:hypothetical protein